MPNLASKLTYKIYHQLVLFPTILAAIFAEIIVSPFPSFNNEKAKPVSKEASVFFGFISVVRNVHQESNKFKPAEKKSGNVGVLGKLPEAKQTQNVMLDCSNL